MTYQFTPTVNDAQEFIEISRDFSNPLDLVREAISNSFDAKATEIKILFDMVLECGESVLKIQIEDNGTGMDKEGLQSFFDLGNSLRRENKEVTHAIGEKGHGTKVYFNSKKIEVITCKDGKKLHAVMDEPKKNLFNKIVPIVNVEEEPANSEENSYTKISIYGYDNNRCDKYHHRLLKDYIYWFTKFGSIERCFGINENENVIMKLRGFGWDKKKEEAEYEILKFGHIFPEESKDLNKLISDVKYIVDAPKFFCKKIYLTEERYLKKRPDISFQAVFYIEGSKVKYEYNKMLRHSGYIAPYGSYQVQERYGLWLCKDFIPIQRKNEWISPKGSEFTKFHAFVNCQALELTANRGSIENTPSEILAELQNEIEEIYNEIVSSDDWSDLTYLEEESNAYHTVEQEKKDFEKRKRWAKKALVAEYKVNDDITLQLIEPRQECGVYTIFIQLTSFLPDLFPFHIVNYDTHMGIDVIVKGNNQLPGQENNLYYVEFKNYLKKEFNHSFENLFSIVCWDFGNDLETKEEKIIDIQNKERFLKQVERDENEKGSYTRFFLDAPKESRKIEVFVLKLYLEEKLGIVFKKRTESQKI